MPHTGVKRSTLIGITGGSGSGKTTLAHLLKDHFQNKLGVSISLLTQDHYYIDQSHRFTGDGESVNFDHPSALDWPHMALHLTQLKNGETAQIPIYDFATHKRLKETAPLAASPILLVDGTLILSQPEIRSHFSKTIFVDTPEDIRFSRRLNRDTVERGRTPEGVRKQFLNHVKPMHDLYVEPFKGLATQVISGTEKVSDYLVMLGESIELG
jgi:uridine kinase